MKNIVIIGVAALLAIGVYNRTDACKDRRPFDVGNSTLGASGTYCADSWLFK